MLTFVTIVHVILCVFMIFVILLQPGKDAGMGAALGGGAATSAFGGRGATTFLTKVTAICAALFFLTSLGLSFVGMKSSVATAGTPVKQTKTAAADAGTVIDGGMTTAPQTIETPTGTAAATTTTVSGDAGAAVTGTATDGGTK